ncbi:MAG: hypothetical protein ACOYOF_15245 [Verrucomicrobiaceae bacterium]
MNLLARSLTLSFCIVTTITLRADEFEDSLTAALKAYKENKIDDASTALQNATRIIAEKSGEKLEDVLPKTIGAWTRGRLETQSLASAGGGTTTKVNYKKGDKEKGTEERISVNVTADSPMLMQVAAFLKAPALGSLLGQKTKQIGDYSGMYISKEGILQFPVNERYMVIIQGKKIPEDQLMIIAKGINADLLKGMK